MSGRTLNRRELLVAGGAAAAAVPSLLHAGEGEAKKEMPLRRLGRINEKVPRLLLGTAMQFNMGLLKHAVDNGITYFDTADCYVDGASETTIGRFIEASGLRKKLWITTKSDAHDPAGVEKSLAQSLERLKTDYVDLLFLHNLRDPGKLNAGMKAMAEKLKREKKIRAFGFSTHAGTVNETLRAAAGVGWVDVIMFKYNFRQYGDVELNKSIDRARAADIGLIAMKTQDSAFSFMGKVEPFTARGFNQYQAVLKGAWEDDRIDAVVSEMKSVQQVDENAAAAKDTGKLGAVHMDRLHRYARATDHLYCRGCDQLCASGLDHPAAIGDTLRYLMYHDEYGERDRARQLWRALPEEARDIPDGRLAEVTRACPYGVDVATLVKRARFVLA